mgnify:FL=1
MYIKKELKIRVSYKDNNEVIGYERVNDNGHWEHLRVNRTIWLLGAITDGQEYRDLIRDEYTGAKDMAEDEIYDNDSIRLYYHVTGVDITAVSVVAYKNDRFGFETENFGWIDIMDINKSPYHIKVKVIGK